MAQPRLALSMARDGLLSSRIFADMDSRGNLWGGTLVSGIAMTVVATVVPFTYLDDLISAGILVAFCITNSSTVLLRCESPPHHPQLLERCLIVYSAGCFVTVVLWSHDALFGVGNAAWNLQRSLAIVSLLCTLLALGYLTVKCPRSAHFGGSIWPAAAPIVDAADDQSGSPYFSVPFVPHVPCAGMAINMYLIAQLSVSGILLLLLYVGLTVAAYLSACSHNSVGHRSNWRRFHRHLSDNYDDEDESAIVMGPMRTAPAPHHSRDDVDHHPTVAAIIHSKQDDREYEQEVDDGLVEAHRKLLG